VVALLLGAVPVILGIADLRAAATVTEQVMRARNFVESRNDNSTTYRYWIAIDDGRSRSTHAYGIDGDRWSQLTEGHLVEARVGRWLGWMHDFQILRPSSLLRRIVFLSRARGSEAIRRHQNGVVDYSRHSSSASRYLLQEQRVRRKELR
jgi:hypothetical protein